MKRRSRLPGADELFRATAGTSAALAAAPAVAPAVDHLARPDEFTGRDGWGSRAAAENLTRAAVRVAPSAGEPRPTGRERHDEKITVYCSPEELLQLEQARLTLRGLHGLAVDRGRIVREAVAVVLADLEAKGDTSILVRRLRGR
jgi:hypothetical protein